MDVMWCARQACTKKGLHITTPRESRAGSGNQEKGEIILIVQCDEHYLLSTTPRPLPLKNLQRVGIETQEEASQVSTPMYTMITQLYTP